MCTHKGPATCNGESVPHTVEGIVSCKPDGQREECAPQRHHHHHHQKHSMKKKENRLKYECKRLAVFRILRNCRPTSVPPPGPSDDHLQSRLSDKTCMFDIDDAGMHGAPFLFVVRLLSSLLCHML